MITLTSALIYIFIITLADLDELTENVQRTSVDVIDF